MTQKKTSLTLNGFSVEHIRNRNEQRAAGILAEVLEEFPQFCNCQLCTEDIYGITINQLPPRYIQVGGLNLNKGLSDDDVKTIAREAIQRVMNKPSHAVMDD